jgi:hypothetical protein
MHYEWPQKTEDWPARITLKIRTELCRWQLEPLVLHCMAVPGFVPWSASLIVYYFKLFSTDFGSTQIFCTMRLADHGTKPGTAIQCKSTLKCWNEVHQYCSVSNQTSGTPCIGYTRYMPLWLVFPNMFIIKLFSYDLKTYTK